MIPNEIEVLTAKDAINAGLLRAIKRSEAKLSGNYKITADERFNFDQNNFLFTDKVGRLCVGKFKDEGEILHLFYLRL